MRRRRHRDTHSRALPPSPIPRLSPPTQEYRAIAEGMKQGTLHEAEPQASAAPAAPKVEAGISSTPLSTIRSPPAYTFGNASREELANVYDKVGLGQSVSATQPPPRGVAPPDRAHLPSRGCSCHHASPDHARQAVSNAAPGNLSPGPVYSIPSAFGTWSVKNAAASQTQRSTGQMLSTVPPPPITRPSSFLPRPRSSHRWAH